MKKSVFVDFLSKNAAEAKVPSESDIKMENMHMAFMMGIWETENQLTTNLLGELSIKQKPKPVKKVPATK